MGVIDISKALRKQRTENYFIDAVCDIIRNEGMNFATIRNVAEKAGYNSATIYTYFENFSHLLLRAHLRFENELLEKIKNDDKIKRADKLFTIWADVYVIMANYYLTNPNVFECVFVSIYEEGIPDELKSMREQHSEFAHYINESLAKISTETGVPIEHINKINETCISLTVGTILLYLKQRFSNTHEEVLKNLEKQINYIIHNNFD